MPPPETPLWLQPVPRWWARMAGAVLLVAAVGLTTLVAYQAFMLTMGREPGWRFTSATLILLLGQVMLGGMCWQAGFRLAFGPPRSLFSRPAWLAIGVMLMVACLLMAGAIVAARLPNARDLVVVSSLGGFGVWCFVLAWRSPGV